MAAKKKVRKKKGAPKKRARRPNPLAGVKLSVTREYPTDRGVLFVVHVGAGKHRLEIGRVVADTEFDARKKAAQFLKRGL